jgi:hypothetical protein
MILNNGSAKVISLCALLIMAVLLNGIYPETQYFSKTSGEINSCKCVIFRLDDISEKFLGDVQIEIMNLFISRSESLSLGLIMNELGKDYKILNKISEGWDHINYTTLSQLEQKNSLFKANEKMRMLFGKRSDIFIPPYNKFDNATLNSMKDIGIKIESSSIPNENTFDQGNSILTFSGKKQDNRSSQEVYHIPYTTDFKKFIGNAQIKVPIDEVAKGIWTNIDKFGYSVVIIHPQNFIKLDESGYFEGGKAQIDKKQIKDLEYLIDLIDQKGVTICSFQKVLEAATSN